MGGTETREPTVLSDDLVALQEVDTAIDQLGFRRARLPEREAAAAAASQRDASRRRAAAIAARQAEIEAAVAAAEDEGTQLTKQRERLQAQLKTVIAPREAEALMHELETIAARRDSLDDVELEHLEEDARLAGELAEVEAAVPAQDEAKAVADGALAAALAEIDAEVAALADRRNELAGRLDASALGDYDAARRHHGGVAIARLAGRQCTGCHMDLSTSEFERVKATAATAIAECPNCGRLLVP